MLVDFKDALRKGLEAARAAEKARREIDQVFDELNCQISEESDGKLAIERKLVSDRGALTLDIALSALGHQKPMHWAIVASNPSIKDTPQKELARWSQPSEGYPCKVSWSGGEDVYCEDKEALEQRLEAMLRDASIAEKLYVLMNLPKP